MRIYLDLVLLLNTAVDFLLLLAANRLCGVPRRLARCLAAAVLGGAYACLCCLPGCRFLGNGLWRAVSLAAMGMIAFGYSFSGLRRCVLFVLLSMALGGLATAFGSGSLWSLLLCVSVLAAMCALGFRHRPGSRRFVPVCLRHNGKTEKLLALCDTGNSLTDPVTGQSVLVVGADTAFRLLGFTPRQLADPVSALQSKAYPGLRLIPMQTVGQSGGFLLALRLPEVEIGSQTGSVLVAFSPVILDREGAYQALLGGNL